MRTDILDMLPTQLIYILLETPGVALVVIIAVAIVTVTCMCIVCRADGNRTQHIPYSGNNLQAECSTYQQNNSYDSTRWRISSKLSQDEIGSNFNKWRKPISKFGEDEDEMPGQLFLQFDGFDINGDKWQRATEIVNNVLWMLFTEIKSEVSKYEGLVINRHLKQGSSREGLKVVKADEFDVLLEFQINGLRLQTKQLQYDSQTVPELAYLTVQESRATLQRRYPKLYNADVFQTNCDIYEICLSSRILHERVFTSIIDRARCKIEKRVNEGSVGRRLDFKIRRYTNAPSVNIKIDITDNNKAFEQLIKTRKDYFDFVDEYNTMKITTIDVDIVPGLLIRTDTVPDPTSRGNTMTCPVHAVFKWTTDTHSQGGESDLIWRICSSGYEKHVIDITRGNISQLYIITALRVAKAYFRKMKKGRYSPRIVTVLRSYHLKHVAFYCILYLTVMNNANITGVRMALAYFLNFLEVSLEERCLPHIFHGNPWIIYMFPEYKYDQHCSKYDLFVGKKPDDLCQALFSLQHMRNTLRKFYVTDFVYKDYSERFRDYVLAGSYYKI